MNSDIRISISFKGHRKRSRLRRIIGDRSDSFLIDLWITVALDCPNGHLIGWDEIDIADSCGWPGDPKEIVDALIESGWLEKDVDGEYAMHDWCEHQAWACGADARSMKAKKAAAIRWGQGLEKDTKKEKAGCNNSNHSKGYCPEHAQRNTPILSLPSPSPLKDLSDSIEPGVEKKAPKKNEGIVIDVISFLNETSGKTFKSNSKATVAHINARIKEGFSLDDFKTVISLKTKQWIDDPNMSGYLRPVTLFGTKMESYLNESPVNPKPQTPEEIRKAHGF